MGTLANSEDTGENLGLHCLLRKDRKKEFNTFWNLQPVTR